jgi:chaperonin GroEL
MEEIRNTIANEESKHIQGVHKERLARMQAKIAEIQIGGRSDVERGEERDLIIDSLNSAKSAMQYGVLPGGGVALYQASKLLVDGLPSLTVDRFEQIGVKILAKALQKPL